MKRERRAFSAEFKAQTVADIRSGKRSVADVHRQFNISRSVIGTWMKKNKQGKYPTRVPIRAKELHVRATMPSTLLDRALAAAPKVQPPKERADGQIAQHVELAEAFILERVSDVQVKIALGRERDSRFITTAWLGRVLTGALKAGWKLEKP